MTQHIYPVCVQSFGTMPRDFFHPLHPPPCFLCLDFLMSSKCAVWLLPCFLCYSFSLSIYLSIFACGCTLSTQCPGRRWKTGSWGEEEEEEGVVRSLPFCACKQLHVTENLSSFLLNVPKQTSPTNTYTYCIYVHTHMPTWSPSSCSSSCPLHVLEPPLLPGFGLPARSSARSLP